MVYLFSSSGIHENATSEHALLERITQLSGRSLLPFSDSAQEVLAHLSSRLLINRDRPQLVALGYWLRRASIMRLKEFFLSKIPTNQVAVARGIAFHLPPANVDTIFVYSWALSLLAGNANIVRLPRQRSPHVEWLIRTIIEVLRDFREDERNIFCTYDTSSHVNREISSVSDLRVIWGGDAKVNQLSADRVKPGGLSIGFPDRKSFSMINCASYDSLDSLSRDGLAERLYNDIYWFDQMACGSPRVIAWVGEPAACSKLSQDLYLRVAQIVSRKGYPIEIGLACDKFSYLNDMLASGEGLLARRFSNALSVIDLDPRTICPPLKVLGGGYLRHAVFSKIEETIALVDGATQTITHFGFDAGSLNSLVASLARKGGFRVVPVGQALTFDTTWDGMPLLDYMTRRIVLIL